MLKARTVNIYGFIAIGIMLLMLVLIWAQLVPRSMYISMFLVAVALFLIRVTMRLVLARQARGAQMPGPAKKELKAGAEEGAEPGKRTDPRG
jgi:hypothetical protein